MLITVRLTLCLAALQLDANKQDVNKDTQSPQGEGPTPAPTATTPKPTAVPQDMPVSR